MIFRCWLLVVAAVAVAVHVDVAVDGVVHDIAVVVVAPDSKAEGRLRTCLHPSHGTLCMAALWCCIIIIISLRLDGARAITDN